MSCPLFFFSVVNTIILRTHREVNAEFFLKWNFIQCVLRLWITLRWKTLCCNNLFLNFLVLVLALICIFLSALFSNTAFHHQCWQANTQQLQKDKEEENPTHWTATFLLLSVMSYRFPRKELNDDRNVCEEKKSCSPFPHPQNTFHGISAAHKHLSTFCPKENPVLLQRKVKF